ncbi:Superoxide dismutase family protein [Candidatus Hepatincolaceae symbiont of Richtersius coronifer]
MKKMMIILLSTYMTYTNAYGANLHAATSSSPLAPIPAPPIATPNTSTPSAMANTNITSRPNNNISPTPATAAATLNPTSTPSSVNNTNTASNNLGRSTSSAVSANASPSKAESTQTNLNSTASRVSPNVIATPADPNLGKGTNSGTLNNRPTNNMNPNDNPSISNDKTFTSTLSTGVASNSKGATERQMSTQPNTQPILGQPNVQTMGNQTANSATHVLTEGNEANNGNASDNSMPPTVITTKIVVNLQTLTSRASDIGTILIEETPYGLLLTLKLRGITPGLHGLAIHDNPSCEAEVVNGINVAGLKAGGHYDPQQNGKHGGPFEENSHLGDLPVIYADMAGVVNYQVLAPRIKSISEIFNRSIIVHMNNDNYSEQPELLGGAGGRLACGIIK